MTQIQKIIKNLALAFAFFLIFSIISGIMYGILSFTNILDEGHHIMEKLEELEISDEASILDIEVSSANIIIKHGASLKVETNNKYIEVEEKDEKLFVTEEKHNWFSKSDESDLVIYVPNDFVFDGVSLVSGAGQINISSLSTKTLDFELGAGKVTIDNLKVIDDAVIEGGAGQINILNGDINNLGLDMGVGELQLSAKLTGTIEIDAGIGKVNLNLIGNDYKIKVDKGIGNATINGESVDDDSYYGEGANTIDIDGGIGNIEISYDKK